MHPTAFEEEAHAAAIDAFIQTLTRPPFRTAPAYVPTIVLGDFNVLVGTSWPAGTSKVYAPTDVLAVAVGTDDCALPPAHSLQLDSGIVVPQQHRLRLLRVSFALACTRAGANPTSLAPQTRVMQSVARRLRRVSGRNLRVAQPS